MGATGATGGALLTRLIDLGVPCRALSRHPDRLRTDISRTPDVEIHYADAADSDSLRAVFDGATQLFLTMPNSPDQVALETRVIEAAADRGIEHIVKLSAPTAAPDSPVAIARWHCEIEQVLRASGIAHTVLRPYAFMQKLALLGREVATRGAIVGTMGSAACNYIDCRDIADVAAAALTRPDIAGGTYTLTGSRTFGYPELAVLLSELLNTPIEYIDLPPTAFREYLIERSHLPHWLADHLTEIQRLAVEHPERPTDTVARILGRPPRTLESFLTENLGAFRQSTAATEQR
ncbi:NAD(P)H-binding protein [Nocardia sp. NBC_01503]|uniref:NmrA family NAD(P)-binding protein n=1 Tax=Nocardia sp. NBC_01503 TaxID=2975997 RepID=UPI002E7B14AF|nr:NAD(P)H-binding protein [Nocardia sp. NBC_01503]WTL31712.1 NAD(P)H-binding protein [Nocardia sp. NBC_01503]